MSLHETALKVETANDDEDDANLIMQDALVADEAALLVNAGPNGLITLVGGFGKFHKRTALLLVALIWFFCGANTILMTFVTMSPPRFQACATGDSWSICSPAKILPDHDCDTPYLYAHSTASVISEFRVPPRPCSSNFLKGAAGVNSGYFFGFLLGVSVLGRLADSIGRRKGLLLAILAMQLGSLGTVFAGSLLHFGATRILTGFGVGGSGLLAFLILAEVTQENRRPVVTLIHAVAFAMGCCYAACLGSFLPNWRLTMAAIAVPGLTCIVSACSRRLAPESPRWLAAASRGQEALDVWQYIASVNGNALPRSVTAEALVALALTTKASDIEMQSTDGSNKHYQHVRGASFERMQKYRDFDEDTSFDKVDGFKPGHASTQEDDGLAEEKNSCNKENRDDGMNSSPFTTSSSQNTREPFTVSSEPEDEQDQRRNQDLSDSRPNQEETLGAFASTPFGDISRASNQKSKSTERNASAEKLGLLRRQSAELLTFALSREKDTLWKAMRVKPLNQWMAVLSVLWFTAAFSYYGIYFEESSILSANKTLLVDGTIPASVSFTTLAPLSDADSAPAIGGIFVAGNANHEQIGTDNGSEVVPPTNRRLRSPLYHTSFFARNPSRSYTLNPGKPRLLSIDEPEQSAGENSLSEARNPMGLHHAILPSIADLAPTDQDGIMSISAPLKSSEIETIDSNTAALSGVAALPLPNRSPSLIYDQLLKDSGPDVASSVKKYGWVLPSSSENTGMPTSQFTPEATTESKIAIIGADMNNTSFVGETLIEENKFADLRDYLKGKTNETYASFKSGFGAVKNVSLPIIHKVGKQVGDELSKGFYQVQQEINDLRLGEIIKAKDDHEQTAIAQPLISRLKQKMLYNFEADDLAHDYWILMRRTGLTVFLSFLFEIPVIFLAMYLVGLQKVGRRGVLLSGFLLGGGFLVMAFTLLHSRQITRIAGTVDESSTVATESLIFSLSSNAVTIMANCGRLAISASFLLLYLYSTELFPTSIRASTVGMLSTVARIGGIAAPLVVAALDSSLMSGASLLLFAACALLSFSLAFFMLPETLGEPLADSIVAVVRKKRTLKVEPSNRCWAFWRRRRP